MERERERKREREREDTAHLKSSKLDHVFLYVLSYGEGIEIEPMLPPKPLARLLPPTTRHRYTVLSEGENILYNRASLSTPSPSEYSNFTMQPRVKKKKAWPVPLTAVNSNIISLAGNK